MLFPFGTGQMQRSSFTLQLDGKQGRAALHAGRGAYDDAYAFQVGGTGAGLMSHECNNFKALPYRQTTRKKKQNKTKTTHKTNDYAK